MNRLWYNLHWSQKNILSYSPNDTTSKSNTFTVIMEYSQWRLSKTMSQLATNSNPFVEFARIGKLMSLNVILVSSQLMLWQCCSMQCKCGWMLSLQNFGAMLFMHAVCLHNCIAWSNETKSLFTLFGSLVYVLDLSSQSGTLGPGKWKKRLYQGMYIGHSLHHGSNVILVYNPKTWLVSPQYHIVHDESFKTVQIHTSDADVQWQLDEMLDALFTTSWWIHSDAYTDCDPLSTSHHYLDSSWDLTN